jgi:7,8-dihydropterin-6-yl-methyl-4-(beta-D-ribofuranosyl)aminobenzene 5'-phosphate synthase
MQEIDSVEITTLQDNYIDLITRDESAVIQRAVPLTPALEINNSVLAEHGFASLVTVYTGGGGRCLLFDFGFSAHGAAFNADALSLDLSNVEALVLSHGHPDHTGGFRNISKKLKRSGLEFVAHPAAFRSNRCQKITQDFKISFPAFTRENVRRAGAIFVESEGPRELLDGMALFLGEIPRLTAFEKVGTTFCYEDNGQDRLDLIEDDTALVFNVKGKGLVVLTGCCHSGIINTVKYAQKVTGVNEIFAAMGGFHLSGADSDLVVAPTATALLELNPRYVVPAHCTGRAASDYIRDKMPDRFLLNMSGTRLTFSSTG